VKHIEVVAAIILNQNKILCMQRPKSDKIYISCKYEFPGGKIEAGETKTEALMRELYEEMKLSVDISEEDFFMTVNHAYPDFELTLHCYICRVDTPEFVRQEHIDHKWVPPADLLKLDWAGADLPIVEKLMELNIC